GRGARRPAARNIAACRNGRQRAEVADENHFRASVEHEHDGCLVRLPVTRSSCHSRPLSDISHIRWPDHPLLPRKPFPVAGGLIQGTNTMKRTMAVCIGLLALAGPAAAETPVAVVEDVQGKVTGAEFMDYVTPKTVIKVPTGGSVTISYMKSCQREKI